jgi:GNAT superfamily N-acetyltransferase
MSAPSLYVQAAASSGLPSLIPWAAEQEVLCALADADGRSAASESRDLPPAGLLPFDSAHHLAAALRWAVAYTNALGLLSGGLRARVASAHPADLEYMHGFVRELAAFEREPDAVITSPASFLRDGFGPAQQFHCVFVEGPASSPCAVRGADGAPSPWAADFAPVGMALFHSSFSTWQGRTIYVEDVYITPGARRLGVGAHLFKVCARAARAAGAKRLQWTCLDWNEPARAMYGKLGAQPLSEWTLFRLDADGIEGVARDSAKASSL